jgi:hypothetical protein
MHAYKKKHENPQKGIDSQGISIEKTGYCRGNFRLVDRGFGCGGSWLGRTRVRHFVGISSEDASVCLAVETPRCGYLGQPCAAHSNSDGLRRHRIPQ